MCAEMLMKLPDPDWLELLRTEVAKDGKTIASVAREINMPRPSLSLLLSGNYPASMDKKGQKFAPVIFALYKNRQFCPHQRAAISMNLCRSHAAAPMSTSNPIRLAQWQACRDCPHNPEQEAQHG